MKRIVLSALLAGLCLFAAVGCAKQSPPPALEEVKETFVSLLEASVPVNDVLFGEGLPYHDMDSEFAKEHHIYDASINFGTYRYVTADAEYHSAKEIREAAERVYSAAYLGGIAGSLFEGVSLVSGGTLVVGIARYFDGPEGLLISSSWADDMEYPATPRIFLYDSMKIVSGDENTADVEILWKESPGAEPEKTRIRFVKEPDGWRLDSPTY